MSLERRQRLLTLAHQHGSWIVEDDYDSEFRFSGQPIPALQGLVPEAPVVYVGTFSKTLYPGLRLGYVVLPRPLAAELKTPTPSSTAAAIRLSSWRWRNLSTPVITRHIFAACACSTAAVASFDRADSAALRAARAVGLQR